MATRKPAKKSPAEVGVERRNPPGLVEDAKPGNREALARAYGHAGAWLRDGQIPPKDLADWLAERLLRLSAVLRDRHDKKLAKVNAALGLVETGKRGKKPASKSDDAKRRDLVLDVHYQRARWGGTLPEVFDRVVAFHASAGHLITPVQVESAWKDRKTLIPEMDS